MKFGTFYSHDLKKQVKQVNKTQAKKLYDENVTIYFKASNLRFDNLWSYPCPIKKERRMLGETFEIVCADFRYYNCDSYRGKYIQFFVEMN